MYKCDCKTTSVNKQVSRHQDMHYTNGFVTGSKLRYRKPSNDTSTQMQVQDVMCETRLQANGASNVGVEGTWGAMYIASSAFPSTSEKPQAFRLSTYISIKRFRPDMKRHEEHTRTGQASSDKMRQHTGCSNQVQLAPRHLSIIAMHSFVHEI